jgi:hypothetical protein
VRGIERTSARRRWETGGSLCMMWSCGASG